jgi:hypothetical protein
MTPLDDAEAHDPDRIGAPGAPCRGRRQPVYDQGPGRMARRRSGKESA